MTPLASLLAAVEAGEFDATPERPTPKFNAFCRAWEAAFDYAHHYEKGWDVYYRKDVNAAMSLLWAMLPGVRTKIVGPLDNGDWMVNIPGQDSVFNSELARALLIAMLRACRKGGGVMKIPRASRRTYGKSLRAICKRLKLPFVKVKPKPKAVQEGE